MRRWLLPLVVVAAVMPLLAQTPEQKALAFEVASIKLAAPFAPRPGRLGSVNVMTTPGRLIARNANLKELIRDAYSLDDYQVIGGPTWLFIYTIRRRGKGSRNANPRTTSDDASESAARAFQARDTPRFEGTFCVCPGARQEWSEVSPTRRGRTAVLSDVPGTGSNKSTAPKRCAFAGALPYSPWR